MPLAKNMSSINELFVKHFENICKALVKQPPSVCILHVACACSPACAGCLSECTSRPLLLPIIPQLHWSTNTGTNGISHPLAIAPYQAQDCKAQQNPCYEMLCAHPLHVSLLRICCQWGFFTSERGETVFELSWDIAGTDGH